MGDILGIGTTHYPPGLKMELVDWVETWMFNAPKCQAIFR